MSHARTLRLLTVLLALLLAACDADSQYSQRFPCSFVFQAQYHTTSLLTRSLGNPGAFVIVSVQQRQGVTHLLVSSNNGADSEDLPMTTAVENDRTHYQNVGAYQSLIIGLSHFDGLKAYDRQCPNCMENYGSFSFPLSFTADGQAASCARCRVSYNLNAEGMPINGHAADRALLQYKVSYNGSVLHVHN